MQILIGGSAKAESKRSCLDAGKQRKEGLNSISKFPDKCTRQWTSWQALQENFIVATCLPEQG